MNKKLILAALIFLLVSVVSISILTLEKIQKDKTITSDQNNQVVNGELILFYGEGCPHCLKVESYIEENKVTDKIDLQLKEVWNNEENHNLMIEKVKACNLGNKSVGVPFLWDAGNSKCLMGDSNVIDYLQSKVNANSANGSKTE